MAVQAERAQFNDQYQALNQTLTRWDRRERLVQSFKWLPRSLIIALSFAIVLAVISRLRPFLLPNQLIAASLALSAASVFFCLGLIWFRRRSKIESARHFDVLFNLGERVSTALELIEGRITTNQELMTRQITNTHLVTQSVKADPTLAVKLSPRDIFAVVIFALIFGLLVWLPNPQAAAIGENAEQEIAIQAAEETLRELTEAIASNVDLSPQSRDNLLEALDQSRRTLERGNITPEEAFAAISSAASALQQQAQTLNDSAAAAQNALTQAAQRLQQFSSQTSDQAATAPEDLAETLAQLSQQLEDFEEQQRQDAAQSLQEAAQNLSQQQQSQLAQQLAQQMGQASQQMQNGQTNNAQQSLDQAQQTAQQMQQQAQNQQNTAQQLEQSAQNVNQAAQQLSQQSGSQGGEDEPQSSQGQGQQGDDAGQGQNPSQSSGNAPESEGEGEGASGDGESNTPSESEGDGQGSGEGGEQSQEGQGASSGDGNGSAGDESGGESNTTGTQQTNIDRNNNPDGEGLREYAPIYRPPLNLNAGDNPIFLDPNNSEAPVIEGNFTENPSGEALVPYNQVFSDYRNAANRALNSGSIPLSMQDVIRDYFSSLDP